MLHPPNCFAAVILCCSPLFLQRNWRHAQALLARAILAPSQQTVTIILRITGRWARSIGDASPTSAASSTGAASISSDANCPMGRRSDLVQNAAA